MATTLERWLPGVRTARRYKRAWLWPDIRSGIVVTALLIPAGMGYAQVSGLPPVTGLYATVIPLLAYALVGPSRILVLGPDSALAPIIGAAILPLALGDDDRAVALAGLLAIMVGLVMLLAGVVNLGFVTDLLSKPVRLGYLNAIALIVIVSQIPTLLGFSVDADGIGARVVEIGRALADGAVGPTAAAIGVGSLAIILVLRRVKFPVPGVLVAVVVAMVVTWAFSLADALPTVGALPQGLPAPALGGLEWSDVKDLAIPALGIALVAFTDSAVLSRTLAARRGETVRGSDELRGIGIANIAGGAMGGFPISASSSRTPVAEQAGSKSQLTGVVGAVLLVVFMLLMPGLTVVLPKATLAAVVIAAVITLIDVKAVRTLWRIDKIELGLSMAALTGVLVFGVLEGIGAAVVLSMFAFVRRSWRPYRAELGRVHGLRGYHDLTRFPEQGERIPGLVIVRFDAPLFFANGEAFARWVRARVKAAGPDVTTVILASEPITAVDTTAVDQLVELEEWLAKHGVTLVFAEMKDPVVDTLRRYGVADRFPADRFAPTVGAAVDRVTGVLRGDLEGTRWDVAADGGEEGAAGEVEVEVEGEGAGRSESDEGPESNP
ncbi:SulP family inorganic anion transporter [Demequina pelophila]|uniref:SulP family inorganic anion transporter n=1 Tax=Demequina pelophila TaxID=1638984 RepID=UPI0009E51ACC|nr:SulP family inorganic anion transporter [Demequina pelophila]